MIKNFKLFGHNIHISPRAEHRADNPPKSGDVVVIIPHDEWRRQRDELIYKGLMLPAQAARICGTVQILERPSGNAQDIWFLRGQDDPVRSTDFQLCRPLEK